MGSQGHSYILVLNGGPDEVTSKVFVKPWQGVGGVWSWFRSIDVH